MKNSNVKSVIGMVVMSIFFIAASTNNAHAQSPNQKVRKNRKQVVVVKNNGKSRTKNVRVVTVPQNARVVRHNQVDYRYHNGNYYRPVNDGYVNAGAPSGMRINKLPDGYRKINRNGKEYYRVGNTYYKPIHASGIVVYEVIYL